MLRYFEIMARRKIICIVGPTASGKTGLGVYLAKKVGGEIVSADSRQVYKKLDIGSGKDLEEYGDIKYHLIDVVKPEEKFTMFDWLEKARIIIEDIFDRGKVPIIVGGTGLYVKALVQGFYITQKVKIKKYSHNSKLKNFSREELDERSLGQLQEIAKKLGLNTEKLDFQNPRRLIRAIERKQEGIKITKKKPDFEALQIGISTPREDLYEKIDRRVESRFKDGMLEEVKRLIDSGVSTKWLLQLGLEYRIITEYLLCHPALDAGSKSIDSRFRENDNKSGNKDGENDKFEEMKQELKWKSHGYARRQLTWLRRFPEIKWVKDKKEAEKIAKDFFRK
ncbi:MAG: tRNA (adenosine(37)-N6)-dimethylallyltransferase MiaA [Candidatus Berkelbacteria bacterium]|nr:tRNA (adenosine(37)-N6)-dimethylallyltransferase MiaA [Candidatus Berkelbacteria bacterium]